MSRPQNKNYRVAITNHGNYPGTVIGWVPEQFALRLQNNWEQYYANLLENLQGINATGAAFGGTSFFLKSATGHVWMGTEAISFQMQLQFDADEDVYSDVYEPVEKLITWASPSYNGGGMMTAPGPNLAYQTNRMSLRIGNFLYFDSVIIPNLDITWHSMMHYSGIPIAADVEIEFKTFYTLTREDILAIFGAGAISGFDGITGSVPGQDINNLVNRGQNWLGGFTSNPMGYLGSLIGGIF